MNLDITRIKTIQRVRQWKIVFMQFILEYIIEDKIDKDGSGLFAILDGHGGGEVS